MKEYSDMMKYICQSIKYGNHNWKVHEFIFDMMVINQCMISPELCHVYTYQANSYYRIFVQVLTVALFKASRTCYIM